MKLLDDTTPEARRVLIDCFRRMPAERKWQVIEDGWQTARVLHAAGVRSRRPNATAEDIRQDWFRLVLQMPAPEGVSVPPTLNESLQVLREVVAVFRAMGIIHAVGGSMASSIHGSPRQTHGADMTVEAYPGREEEFAGHFGEGYYIDVGAIKQAIRARSSFNVINQHIGFKVDIFVRKDRPFELSALQRRVDRPLSQTPGDTVSVLSPEDIVLHKLEWFRLGGEISDRQWGDILGVLRVQGDRIDNAYLDHWAIELGMADLLQQAREQF